MEYDLRNIKNIDDEHDIKSWKPIHYATAFNDIYFLKKLTDRRLNQQHKNINSSYYCKSPIEIAVYMGHYECLQILSEYCKIEPKYIDNITHSLFDVLHIISNENINCLKFLLNEKADPNGPLHNVHTPLMVACHENNIESAKLLLKYKANVNCIDEEDHLTALAYACKYGNDECVKLLLNNKANIYINDMMDNPPLLYAIVGQNVNCIKLLINAKAHINDKVRKEQYLIHTQCLMGNDECLVELLSHGIDINKKMKIWDYSEEYIRFNTSPNYENSYIRMINEIDRTKNKHCVYNDNFSKNIDKNKCSYDCYVELSPFQISCASGNINIAKKLLSLGKINIKQELNEIEKNYDYTIMCNSENVLSKLKTQQSKLQYEFMKIVYSNSINHELTKFFMINKGLKIFLGKYITMFINAF